MGTFVASGAVIEKAGAGVSAALNTEYETWILEAEATCALMSRYDWVASSGAITTSAKAILANIQSDLAAIHAVKYDMTGYASRIEAEDLINVLRDEALRGLMLIRDQKGVTFLK